MNKLKRCPFCGGTDLEIRYLDEDYGECVVDSEEELDENLHPWILCSNCLNETFYRELDTPRDIIKAWNTRKPMEKIKEELEFRKMIASEMNECDVELDSYVSGAFDGAIDIVEKGGME